MDKFDPLGFFNDWLKRNLSAAQEMPLELVIKQTWSAAFQAGQIYFCENPHGPIPYPWDLKKPKPFQDMGLGI